MVERLATFLVTPHGHVDRPSLPWFVHVSSYIFRFPDIKEPLYLLYSTRPCTIALGRQASFPVPLA
jgi:hypothetical protein